MKYTLIETPNKTISINLENLCFLEYDKAAEKLTLGYQAGNTTLEPIEQSIFNKLIEACK